MFAYNNIKHNKYSEYYRDKLNFHKKINVLKYLRKEIVYLLNE